MAKSLTTQFKEVRREYADEINTLIKASPKHEVSVTSASAQTGYSKQSVALFASNHFKGVYKTITKRYVNMDDATDIMEVSKKDWYIQEEEPYQSYRY